MRHIVDFRDSGIRDVLWIAGIWAVLGTGAEFLANWLLATFYPLMISYQGHITADSFAYMFRVDIVVFTLVVIVFVYSLIRFRARDQNDLRPSSRQYRFGPLFAWGWFLSSTIINVMFIIYPGVIGLIQIWNYGASAKNPVVIYVTGQQWHWSFDYPSYHLQGRTSLVLPVNTPIEFKVSSKDVIHSFWVPAFGIKLAAIPGEMRTLYILPDKIISTQMDPLARVQCSQICGVGHAMMRTDLKVLSATDFQKWVTQQQHTPSSGGGSS